MCFIILKYSVGHATLTFRLPHKIKRLLLGRRYDCNLEITGYDILIKKKSWFVFFFFFLNMMIRWVCLMRASQLLYLW